MIDFPPSSLSFLPYNSMKSHNTSSNQPEIGLWNNNSTIHDDKTARDGKKSKEAILNNNI